MADAIPPDAREWNAAVTIRLAEFYRAGLHGLAPWWSPDVDGFVDPLDDDEVRATVRRFFARYQRELEEARRG